MVEEKVVSVQLEVRSSFAYGTLCTASHSPDLH
jgi:hypothetical protein